MERKKVGLALGGGAARGIAHIGVLQVFAEQGIPIDYMSGCSAGAVVGAIYCAGSDLYMLAKLLSSMNEKTFFDFTVPRKGFLKGEKAEELIRVFTKNYTFEECSIPFGVVACDLVTARCVTFREGKLHRAVRASISIPGVFEPVEMGDSVFVDGGVLNRVPINVVREMGAEYVIAVDVAFRGWKRAKPVNIVDVLSQSFELSDWENTKRLLEDCDILLEPDVMEINMASLAQTEDCIQRGRAAALVAVGQIKADLGL